jgi:hypothetical protein
MPICQNNYFDKQPKCQIIICLRITHTENKLVITIFNKNDISGNKYALFLATKVKFFLTAEVKLLLCVPIK